MSERKGEIVAVCISESKGTQKVNVGKGRLKPDHGLAGDSHAGDWHRQVSLLASESIQKMVEMGLQVGPGDFAENLTTRGIQLHDLKVGAALQIGHTEPAILRITQIGKECHSRCAIYHQAGDCIMPREGVFAEVIEGGAVAEGDSIRVVRNEFEYQGKTPSDG